MGSFADAVSRDAQERANDETRCRAVKVADELSEDDRDLYLSLLEKPVGDVGHVWLRDRLRDAGIEAPCVSSIRRHRCGRCLCNDFHYPSNP